MKALEDSGFRIPQAIKKHPTNFGAEVKHYDQIAFNLKLEENIEVFDEVKVRSGAFDFTKSVYRDEDYQEYLPYMMKEVSVPNPDKPGKKMKVKVQRTGEEAQTYFHDTYRIDEMSDHMPLWLELKVDFSAQYIEKQKKETEKRIADLAAKAAAKAKAEAEAAKKG